MLGLSLAFQSVVGNNYGARNFHRSNQALNISLFIALAYCLFVQAIFYIFADSIGFVFVDEKNIINEIGRILPITTLLLFLFGPLLILTTYFQAIGNVRVAAILGLSKTYLFGIPLILFMPFWLGEIGIWLAGPLAELSLLVLAVLLLTRRYRKEGIFLFQATNRV